jgi:hypothetical protein
VKKIIEKIKIKPPAPIRIAMELADRERKHLLSEMVQVKGLMPILMKRRNKQQWTREDKAEIKAQLKRMTQITPYLVVLVMPGGLVVLPALAWWLDRRRNRNRVGLAT